MCNIIKSHSSSIAFQKSFLECLHHSHNIFVYNQTRFHSWMAWNSAKKMLCSFHRGSIRNTSTHHTNCAPSKTAKHAQSRALLLWEPKITKMNVLHSHTLQLSITSPGMSPAFCKIGILLAGSTTQCKPHLVSFYWCRNWKMTRKSTLLNLWVWV